MLYEELRGKQVYIPEGVKKIFEGVIKEGRSLVINDLDLNTDMVPNGTLFVDANTSKMKVKKNNYVESILPTDIFDPEVMTDAVIQKGSVNGNRIRQRTITRDRIQSETLTGSEIENNSVPGSKITSGAIENRHVRSNSIDQHQLINNAVTSEKIRELSINASHISQSAVASAHIKEANILNKHLESEVITSDKIKPKNILSTHIKEHAIFAEHIGDGQIKEMQIADGAVSNIKIAQSSISRDKIQSSAIDGSKIAPGSILTNAIVDGQVSFDKLHYTVKNRIDSSLDVIGGVGKLSTLNASVSVITKDLAASGNTTLSALTCNNNATVKGALHVNGNITTDSKVYRVAFNDIAEAYIPGEKLEAGDVVQIEEDGKIYKSDFMSNAIVGVISDCYGDCFGASAREIEDGTKVPVGLIGKVPVKVFGPIKIGTKIVAGDNGIAYPALDGNTYDAIGKAIESSDHAGINRVLCLIYPN